MNLASHATRVPGGTRNEDDAGLFGERDNMPLPERRSIRLRGYDYTSAGLYYVTLCVTGRECIFGTVRKGSVALSPLGRMVELRWQKLPSFFPNLALDEFVMMPNHLHGILYLAPDEIEVKSPPQPPVRDIFSSGRPCGTRSGSLGAVIQNLKSSTARALNSQLGGNRPWQRNYHEHIIRDADELDRIRTYIRQNPARWNDDEDDPEFNSR